MKILTDNKYTKPLDLNTYDELETYLSRINALTSMAIGSELIENSEEVDCYLAILQEYTTKALNVFHSIEFSKVK